MPRIGFFVDHHFLALLVFPRPSWLMMGNKAVPVGPRDVCLSPC